MTFVLAYFFVGHTVFEKNNHSAANINLKRKRPIKNFVNLISFTFQKEEKLQKWNFLKDLIRNRNSVIV